jgi:hypothetical protein
MKAPLIIGCDLSKATCTDCNSSTEIIHGILLHKPLIEVNQDALGKPVKQVASMQCAPPNTLVTVWAGPLAGGKHVMMFLNKEGDKGDKEDSKLDCPLLSIDLAVALGVPAGTTLACTDLWGDGHCGNSSNSSTLNAGELGANLTLSVLSHEAVVLHFEAVQQVVQQGGGAKRAKHEEPTAREEQEFQSDTPVQAASNTPVQAASKRNQLRVRTQHSTPTAVSFTAHTNKRATRVRVPVGTTSVVRTAPPTWPMRGHDSHHSGRSLATGPTSCVQKWGYGNSTNESPTSGSKESMPAVSRQKLVLAVINYGDQGQGLGGDAVLHAIQVRERRLESIGLHVSSLESIGLHVSSLESIGLHVSRLESTGLHVSRLESTGLHVSSLESMRHCCIILVDTPFIPPLSFASMLQQLDTGEPHWNVTLNGSVWGSPLLVKTSDGGELCIIGEFTRCCLCVLLFVGADVCVG